MAWCPSRGQRWGEGLSGVLYFYSPWVDVSTEADVMVIGTMATKLCQLDPILTCMLKDCLPELLPVITHIVNKTVTFLTQLNQPLLHTPLLKEPNHVPDSLGNYWPISNLMFLSKVLEKAVPTQLISHMGQNCLFESMQSRYKKHHSPETTLACIQNDILWAIDQQKAAVLALLDLIPLTTKFCYHRFTISLASVIRHWIG